MSDVTTPGTPVPYDHTMERVEAGEAETSEALTQALLQISHTTHAHRRHALRSVHAKCHGILHGELQVLDGLAPQWAQGIFARPRRYPVVMRLSTSPGDLLDDSISLPRGLALKVIGVEGERLPGSEAASTQDFLMVDSPTFVVANAKRLLGGMQLLAATTDRAEGLKKAFSAVMRGAERLLESEFVESTAIKGLGGHPMTHLLGETFFTQVPLRHGLYMGKFSLAPVSPELLALKDAPLDLPHQPDGLRDAVRSHFAQQGGEWELRVQLCTDLDAMPIEDASVDWPQSLGAYVAVARVVAPPQVSWDDAGSPAVDDALAFSPWHGVVAHQPLGSVMRARRQAYEASAGFRGSRNGCPMHQPVSVDEALRPQPGQVASTTPASASPNAPA